MTGKSVVEKVGIIYHFIAISGRYEKPDPIIKEKVFFDINNSVYWRLFLNVRNGIDE